MPAIPQPKAPRPRDANLETRVKRMAEARAAEKAATQGGSCKRRARRKQTSLPGLLTFSSMRLALPCLIVDMSGTGARLSFSEAALRSFGDLDMLPKACTLVIRADRVQVECEIKWRRKTGIGVRFLGPQTPLAR